MPQASAMQQAAIHTEGELSLLSSLEASPGYGAQSSETNQPQRKEHAHVAG